MLATTRRLLVADDYVRSGSWAAAKPSPMMRPQAGMLGRRIGVYGMGEIGRKIAARVAAFETEVGYFSRSQHDVPYQYFPTLDALAEWCSVLMIAVRAGGDTASRGRCQYPEQARQGRLRRQHLARLGHRPAGADRGADRPDHRRRRPRRVREGAACAGRADGAAQRRAVAAYRRPYAGIACGDAGLRDRQSRGVFRRQAAALCGATLG